VAALIVFASLALLQYRAIMLAADAERTPFRHRALFCEFIRRLLRNRGVQ